MSTNSPVRSIRSTVLTLTLTALLLVAAGKVVFAAWASDFTGAPYTGIFTLSSPSGHQIALAQYVKWNSAGISSMSSDSDPMFDITADCTVDNPGTDQLHYVYYYATVPNLGFQAWNDCGSLFVHEETELFINPGSVVANAIYDHQVHYERKKTGVAGAINLSYQRGNSPTHDHLDKVLYNN